jgi:hypothetical protein
MKKASKRYRMALSIEIIAKADPLALTGSKEISVIPPIFSPLSCAGGVKLL